MRIAEAWGGEGRDDLVGAGEYAAKYEMCHRKQPAGREQGVGVLRRLRRHEGNVVGGGVGVGVGGGGWVEEGGR